MNVKRFNVLIHSEDPDALRAFYRDIIGLPQHPDPNRPGTLLAGEIEILFHAHSALNGKSTQGERIILNLFIDDLAAEQKRLEQLHVAFIRSAGREFWGGVISTFVDPDGNLCQIIEAPD